MKPTTAIIVVVPFGGFKESALTEAFTTYQQKYNDKQTYLIDLGYSILSSYPFFSFPSFLLSFPFHAFPFPFLLSFSFFSFLVSVSFSCPILYARQYNNNMLIIIIISEPATEGLTKFVNGGTWQSEDGIHPNVWRDGQLGAMLALNIGRALGL